MKLSPRVKNAVEGKKMSKESRRRFKKGGQSSKLPESQEVIFKAKESS